MRMSTPTLFIDGDGCNTQTRELAERLSEKGIHIVLVANRALPYTNEHTSMIVCGAEDHAADKYILAHARKGDMVISKDMELARALLHAHNDDITVISDNGEKFSSKTIDARIIRGTHARERRSMGIIHTTHTRPAHTRIKKARIAHILETWKNTSHTCQRRYQ